MIEEGSTNKPLYLVCIILLIVFAVEMLVMAILLSIQIELGIWLESFIDALALSIISAPFIFMFVIKPIKQKCHKEKVLLELEIENLKKADGINRINSEVMKTSSNGIIITDKNVKIISVNPGFTSVTGYTLDEVIGKGPDILSSGRHDKAFYQEMWNKLKKEGGWQGEIWDRKKNGEIYVEWLRITEIKDDKGNTTNYIAIFEDITQKKIKEEKLIKLATYDALTGLYNRVSFETYLTQLIKQIKRDKGGLYLLFMDLDLFKKVNDLYGHHIGDQVLIYVAKKFLALMREGDVVARLGGDEFAVTLKTKHVNENIKPLLEKLVREVSTPFILEGHPIKVGLSIGVAKFSESRASSELLFQVADKAMYYVKKHGRNNYKIY